MPKWFPSFPEWCERPAGGDICDPETVEIGDAFQVKGLDGVWRPFPWLIAPPASVLHSYGYESASKQSPHYSRIIWLSMRSGLSVRFKPDELGFLKRYFFWFADDARGLGFFQRMIEATDPADVLKDLISSRILYVRSA